MNKLTALPALVIIMGISTSALSSEPSLNSVEANFSSFELEEFGTLHRFDGFNIAGTVQISENFYIPLSYSWYSNDVGRSFVENLATQPRIVIQEQEVEITDVEIGIGYRQLLEDGNFLTYEFGYFELDYDVTNLNVRTVLNGESTQGYNGSGSVSELKSFYWEAKYHHTFTDTFHANVGIRYRGDAANGTELDDRGLTAELQYLLNDNLRLKAGFESGDSEFKFGVQYNF